MRDELAERAGQRLIYIARLTAYGVRHLKGERRKRRGTALMKNVYSEGGDFLTYHVWVSHAEPFVEAGIERGQYVSFTAIATPYLRGYREAQQEMDYMLNDAQDILLLPRSPFRHRPESGSSTEGAEAIGEQIVGYDGG